MCAFLRQRKKERTKRCSLKFLSHKKRRALKKTNFAHRTPLFKCHLLSSDSLVEKSKRVWEGVYFTWYGRVRAREREVQTNQRASSNSPSFFFLAFGEVKKPIKYVRAFGLCHTAAHAFYFLTNFFVCGPQIFCTKRRNKSVRYHRDTLGVCVWGGWERLSCWPRHDIFSTNAIIWCADDAFRERMQEQCAENDDDDEEEEFFLHQKQLLLLLLLLLAGERKKE